MSIKDVFKLNRERIALRALRNDIAKFNEAIETAKEKYGYSEDEAVKFVTKKMFKIKGA